MGTFNMIWLVVCLLVQHFLYNRLLKKTQSKLRDLAKINEDLARVCKLQEQEIYKLKEAKREIDMSYMEIIHKN
jgi:hypothetical protein